MSNLYIGLNSGTSVDAVDGALVDYSDDHFQLIATHSVPIPADIKNDLFELAEPGDNELNRMGILDRKLGHIFAKTATELLTKSALKNNQIVAIGSHGQNIRHLPHLPHGFTLQIGDPNIIAETTGITVVADFRRKDIALGGQGAPLTPAFHYFLFQHREKNRVVVNIGGISNLTLLLADPSKNIIGFDCGPGNMLLDAWCKKHCSKSFDDGGQWAAQGNVIHELLQILLADPFFNLPYPKSTGREYFNLNWLQNKLDQFYLQTKTMGNPVDIQATLLELTTSAISHAINSFSTKVDEIILCGGGTYNRQLWKSLQAKCVNQQILSSEDLGVSPLWLEAMAFAWFAKRTLERKSSNLPLVTGARSAAVLGGVYYC